MPADRSARLRVRRAVRARNQGRRCDRKPARALGSTPSASPRTARACDSGSEPGGRRRWLRRASKALSRALLLERALVAADCAGSAALPSEAARVQKAASLELGAERAVRNQPSELERKRLFAELLQG